jgi:anti-sigma factor NepR-like protein
MTRPARRPDHSAARRPACYVSKRGIAIQVVAPRREISNERVETRARGDEELSARKGSETEGAGHSRHSKKSKTSDRSARKGDLGRALRSVYDDTLREAVPDDLLKIIGKLG